MARWTLRPLASGSFPPIADIREFRHSRHMSRLWNLLASWSNDDQSALRQMTKGKTVGERVAALNRTTVNQSKFLLLAAAPFCLVLIVRKLSGSSGWFWWVVVAA